MLKKKCSSCDRKVDRKFNFCPYCGNSFKIERERENYGFLGSDDSSEVNANLNQGLPFGMEGLIGSLIKQMEKQLNSLDLSDPNSSFPRGFKIKVSTGKPGIKRVEDNNNNNNKPKNKIENFEVDSEEFNRRINLPKVETSSKIRRLSDKIVYEIEVPGVNDKKDITITELASGLEVKAYSKDKCYVKNIPLKVEVIHYHLNQDKLFLELKD